MSTQQIAAPIINSIGEFNAGVFVSKLDQVAKSTALAVVTHKKKGKVCIELDFDLIKGTHQVQVRHTVKYSKPTVNGKLDESDSTETPMYVSKEGDLSVVPDSQMKMFGEEA